MPELILQVVSMDAIPPSQPLMRAFDEAGGTIGRDESNVFALPDKHRRVSRLHATISFPGGMATITNSSTSLPLSVGEQQVDSGESMPLPNGALVEIGPYVLKAVVPLSPASAPQQPRPIDPSLQAPIATSGAELRLDVVPRPAQAVEQLDHVLPALQVPVGKPSPQEARPAADFVQAAGLVADLSLRPTPVLPPAEADQLIATSSPDTAGIDPFANLLAGIGTAAPAHGQFSGSPPQSLGVVSVDPLAAFGPTHGRHIAGSPSPQSNNLQAAYPRPKVESGSALIPDDFNPFELPSNTDRNAADPLANLLGGAPEGSAGIVAAAGQPVPSIDSLFQSGASGVSEASSLGSAAPGISSSDGSLNSLLQSDSASDPFALFGDASGTPLPTNRPMRDDSLEVGSSFLPPAPILEGRADMVRTDAVRQSLPDDPMRSSPPVSAAAGSPYQHPDGVSPDALTEAFLRGAGLTPGALPHGLTPEIMTIVGSLLRSATAGAVDMLAARAATKREVQASVTIISVQANNPLKFLPNADAALLQLLGKKMPGFMRADVAMRDAFEDLRAHEVGVIAGTRAALTEVLGKFDPAVLGDKLARGSVLESLVPSARKAKLWDMYLERYLQIRREAEDDFQSIFGRAFVQAYERETARIKGDPSGSVEGRA